MNTPQNTNVLNKMEINISQQESDSLQDQNKTTVITKLGTCEVCAINEAKYTCPRCELKTCCLNCCKIHKKELKCDGTLNKAKFIRINQFTNLDMANDYRFLEEVNRNVETLKTNLSTKHSRLNSFLPNHLYRLVGAARKRRTILKFLPRDFERHKLNTTYLDFSKNVIFWHIEFIFTNADNLKLCEDKVPEVTKLSNLLHKYLIKQENEVLQEKLKYYQAADLPKIKILLKAEEKSGKKFFELDPLLSLKDNFKNKVIIEFPTIHVVLNEHVDSSCIIDSDDEDGNVKEESVSNGRHVIQRIIENNEKEEHLDGSLQNLLFVSNLSDGDME